MDPIVAACHFSTENACAVVLRAVIMSVFQFTRICFSLFLLLFYFFWEYHQSWEMFLLQLFVYCSTVLSDPSISTHFCFDSNTLLCTTMVCHLTTTVIKYALSHSIGINVAYVGLNRGCFLFVRVKLNIQILWGKIVFSFIGLFLCKMKKCGYDCVSCHVIMPFSKAKCFQSVSC